MIISVARLPMNLSEFLDEIREIEIYDVDPQDWMGYLESDDSFNFETEFVY